jgi:hypothetical protein
MFQGIGEVWRSEVGDKPNEEKRYVNRPQSLSIRLAIGSNNSFGRQQRRRQLATIPPDVERMVKPVKHTIMT